MKNKKIIKMIVDVLMLILMLLEYSRVYTGQLIHEIIGITLFVLFIVHNILNIDFYKNIFKGKYTTQRVIMTINNLVFLLLMLFTITLGIPISEKVFKFLNLDGNMTIRKLHTIFGYWALIVLSIHLGLHYKMIFAKLKNKISNKKILNYIIWIVEIVVVIYGFKVMIDNNFVKYLIGDYAFANVSGNAIITFLNNFSIVMAISIIVYNIEKIFEIKKIN